MKCMTGNSSTPAETSGCLVILERDAEWPLRAFRRTMDRDCVIVMTRQPDEPLGIFLARLGRRFELAGRHAVSVRTVILACSGDEEGAFETRLELLQGVVKHVIHDHETRFVIVADQEKSAGSAGPLAMADALLEDLRGQCVAVDVISGAPSPGQHARSARARCKADTSALHNLA
jgi:hypothetical protein